MQTGGFQMIEIKRNMITVKDEEYSELPSELVQELKGHAPIKLMSSIQVADALDKTRQWVDWAIKKYPEEFPKPLLEVNRYKGWLATDIIHFRDNVLSTLSPETKTNKNG